MRVNGKIRSHEVRVVTDDGQQLGVMGIREALAAAQQRGLDLVEIAPTARPPVCKIIDYGKYKYREEKQSREARKHNVVSKVKELKFHVNIAGHDYATKVNHGIEFLEDGDKVKITMVLRGREMAHKDLGFEIMKRIKSDLQAVGVVEMEPKALGRNIIMMYGPLPASKRAALKKAHEQGAFTLDEDKTVDPVKLAVESKVAAPKPAPAAPAVASDKGFANNPFSQIKK